MQDTNNISQNITSKPALTTELNESYIGKEMYTHGRNLIMGSHLGDAGVIGNEPSTKFCFDIPEGFRGAISLNDDRFLIFSEVEGISRIGIGNTVECTYSSIIEDNCFDFPKGKVISGVAKKLFNDDIIVTFGTKEYTTRRINLNKIPYKYKVGTDVCKTREFNTEINCEETLLFKKLNYPCINITKGYGGNIPNGTYSVVIAYTIDNQVFSDYFSPTQRLQVFEKVGGTASINVTIDNIDRDFNTYQLVLVSNIDGVKTNYIIGEYPTFQTTVEISDLGKDTLSNKTLVLRKKTWESAGIISSNSNYLLLGDLVGRSELNYQPQAMKIKAEYVIRQVPLSYYEEHPDEVGYWGDENYDYGIEILFDTCEFSKRSHIPGKKATNNDRETPHGEDIFEWDADIKPEKLEKWEVENTAGDPIPTNNPFINNQRIAYTGEMGYFQSTELYPDNIDLYGDDACTNIRYHKFPDGIKVPRFENIGGKIYVNIRGIQFSNITYPLDENGDPVKGVKGYRILRSDRKGGNKTVISAGVFTNVRKYTDLQNDREIMFANYPYNDLSADQFLSNTQTTNKGGRETNFKPLTEFYKNRFNYYSAHSFYNLKYKHGTEFKFLSEESANVSGNFEPVFAHPKHQLISNFAFWAAASVGVIEAYLEASGATSKEIESSSQFKKTAFDPGLIDETSTTLAPKSALAASGITTGQLATMVIDAIKSGHVTSIKEIANILKDALKLIATAGVTAILFTISAMKYAQNILDTIYNFLPYEQYAYQYNSHGFFNESIPNKKGNIRRKAITQPQYLSPSLHTIDGVIFNNFGKQESVYVELNDDIEVPRIEDNTRRTISGFKIGKTPERVVNSTASLYYGISKIPNPNQYGQLGTNSQVVVSKCIEYFGDYKKGKTYTTPILFNGDCVIGRNSVMTKHPFFRQNLAIEYGNKLPSNFPDGTTYNYNLYRNIAYPRYWIDSNKYDYSQLLSKNITNFSSFARTATSKHNLDNRATEKNGLFSIDDAYFYLYSNGVLDFITECDYNVSFREETTIPYFSQKSGNLSEIFKSTNLAQQEEFKLNKSFSDIYPIEVYSEILKSDYNPIRDNKTKFPNAVIYSLPSFNLQNFDNWQYFLPTNFFSFSESDFGSLTGIHKLDQDRLIFTFSKSSPFISMGKDFLQLEQSGRKVSIGDGGLFAQDPREIMPTDNNYGACQSPYAFSSNHFGNFYPSEKQGRILQIGESLQDISRAGLSAWCMTYMPIQLYSQFPTYPRIENPIDGVGYLMSFDASYEILYISKRDYIPKEGMDISYANNKFYYKGIEVFLKDSRYFEDISYTLSYSPSGKGFISWHDWHPDWILQGDTNFLSVKDNKVWIHNAETESYNVYYGKEYPFEIEVVNSDGQQINILRSIEYQIEGWHYRNNGRDKYHVLDANFDKMQVSNSEQFSPLYTIVPHPQDPSQRKLYPKGNGGGFDILYTKEENKYRINQFWDAVRDRGEFSDKEFFVFKNHPSGYKKIINPQAIDLNKPERERKKFRHYYTRFWFAKEKAGNTKFLIKLFNQKKNVSFR